MSQGRFSIDSSGYTNMKILAGLGGSKLDARGGIIGGCIELQQLDSEGMIHTQALYLTLPYHMGRRFTA